MSDLIKVGIADYKVSYSPHQLITLGLGSCIGISIYDKINKVGGLAHIMLPYSPPNKSDGFVVEKYADTTIPLLISTIISCGGCLDNLEAKLVGGANMFSSVNCPIEDTVGYKNQLAVKSILNDFNIPIISEELGGNIGRTVILDLSNFDVIIKFRGLYKKI